MQIVRKSAFLIYFLKFWKILEAAVLKNTATMMIL